jgi:hypothetical protein
MITNLKPVFIDREAEAKFVDIAELDSSCEIVGDDVVDDVHAHNRYFEEDETVVVLFFW